MINLCFGFDFKVNLNSYFMDYQKSISIFTIHADINNKQFFYCRRLNPILL